MNVPVEFRRRIRRHNRHAVMMAGLCLLGAWLGWLIAYGLVVGLALGFLTIVDGQAVIEGEKLLNVPCWLNLAAAVLAGILLAWAAWEARWRRFKPVDDRPVVGWHIFGDIVLAPARMTLGIWSHLAAVIRVDHAEEIEAFDLLRHLYENGKCTASHLGAMFSDLSRLRKLLAALQLAGWIDLHRGDDDGFYVVRSDESADVAMMIEPPVAEKAETKET